MKKIALCCILSQINILFLKKNDLLTLLHLIFEKIFEVAKFQQQKNLYSRKYFTMANQNFLLTNRIYFWFEIHVFFMILLGMSFALEQ